MRNVECTFLPSRRGTYPRKKKVGYDAHQPGCNEPTARAVGLGTGVGRAGDLDSACATTSVPRWQADAGHAHRNGSESPARGEPRDAPLRTSSLAAMFEEYLDSQPPPNESVLSKRGVIFLADSSPLTFALGELPRDKTLHNVSSRVTNTASESEEGLAGPQGSPHPVHMSAADIAYLKAKGAFEMPQDELLSALVGAFLDKFCTLYSIVNRDKFVQLYEQQKLPWILMHAVCFIGATYCDQAVIHRSAMQSRWHARRCFYDKAKVLFDLGYETDKIILLQTVLLLTFWGPQMKSYWNPCSWIGFGVTIADSLGIYKSNSSAHQPPAGRSLLRRLWWTLAVRDAYCAALLGRPFRINMARCDTEPLSIDDFYPEDGHDQAAAAARAAESTYAGAQCQIQIAKLSLILRQIMLSKSNGKYDAQVIANLHRLLEQWQADLPAAVDWRTPGNATNLCAMSLKIIFHHHLIVIHLGEPPCGSPDTNSQVDMDSLSIKLAESAAQTIASSAIALMTGSMVGNLPHEVFPGFFIAGIVFYRQMKNQNAMLAQLGQAALDNCQMVMNEARDNWDAAQWALRIFDFLLSKTDRIESQRDKACQQLPNAPAHDFAMSRDITEMDTPAGQLDAAAVVGGDMSATIDLNSLPNQYFMETVNDILLMPDYFMTAAEFDFSVPY
ncbi:hypothetical protein BU26DRAFT_519683 [Trematosphaeria pertusa]|uniref:Xylanolytic transcriptional activator regulatory domain-containing protein n=1 Tax=Trematosphaeria pertusa TaxID=390896 RepID=A0A6A6IBD2_9PLEO|nr:uncharacterized protein BU26DRAFT_519683 [Trematosphaeria pertusa]KAF2247885.1 hypothetical protein BU26DRAFT_519683 [Trematosphaeria pertusa]